MPSDSSNAAVNPFAGAMAQAQTAAKSATEDFTRMFAEMKLPATIDMEALLTAHRRNMEVLSAANRVAMEGAQAVARRNMEIMQQTMAELSDSVRALNLHRGAGPKRPPGRPRCSSTPMSGRWPTRRSSAT